MKSKATSAVDALSEDVLAKVRGAILASSPSKKAEVVLAAIEALWKQGLSPNASSVRRYTGIKDGAVRSAIESLCTSGSLVQLGEGRARVLVTAEMYAAATKGKD